MTELFLVIPPFCISVFQFEGHKFCVIDEISMSLHDLEVFFSAFQNFLELWRWELVTAGTVFLTIFQIFNNL